MALLKVYFVAVAMVAAVMAAPAPPGPQNSYLPPVTGYVYDPPTTPTSTTTTTTPTTPHEHDHHEPGMPFDFAYAVKDVEGADFSHNAASDGDVVRGEYRVLLPDGRTQVVKYTADWKNGYNAEVTYQKP